MKTLLTFNVPGVQFTSIEFDATTSLSHAGDVDITEHPLETGSNIADGARAKQMTLQLEAIITDNPLNGPKGGAGVGVGTAKLKYAALRKVKDLGGVITFASTLESYENMLIKQLSAPESAQMGRAVKFTLQLAQVKLVRSQRVKVAPAKTKKAAGKTPNGPQPTTPAPPAVVRRSMWKAGTSKGGLLGAFVLGN